MAYTFNPFTGTFDYYTPVTAVSPVDVNELNNLRILNSVSANAMTISFRNPSGGNPVTADNVSINFSHLNSTASSTQISRNILNGTYAVTIPSGATLGHVSGVAEPIYVYVINSSSPAIAISTSLFDTNSNVSTTAISGSSNSRLVMYSSSSQSNVSARLIGKFVSTQTTAGTWASNATAISIGYESDVLARRVVGDVSGTAAPAGYIGQVIQTAQSASQNAATTNTFLALASIPLTPGNWLISAYAQLQRGGATFSGDASIVISTTSASASGTTAGYTNIAFTPTTITTADFNSGAIPMYPVSISSNTTYYLNVLCQYSAGTPSWRGVITAVRIG